MTELPATARFSARIRSDLKVAALDTIELSPAAAQAVTCWLEAAALGGP